MDKKVIEISWEGLTPAGQINLDPTLTFKIPGRVLRTIWWTAKEIKAVLDDAMSGDYNHLLCVPTDHSESPKNLDEEDDLEMY